MSPKTASTSAILSAVLNESLGFTFGTPDRPNVDALACLLPILRETAHKRQYVTYGETDQVLVTDSGGISKLNVKNTSKENVFLRSGTIFEGKGTQSRALTRSAVLYPGTEVALDVRCVHASHGIRSGSGFKYGGVTPLDMDSSFYTSGFTPGNQQTMWNNVTASTATMRSSGGRVTLSTTEGPIQSFRAERSAGLRRPMVSAAAGRRMTRLQSSSRAVAAAAFTIQDSAFAGTGSDNLKGEFDAFARDFDGILSKARLHDNQVGIALVTDTGCKTIELFDVPLSWEALHKDAVKRMGTELLRGPDETNVFEYKPERAASAVKKVLGLDYKTNLIYEHKPSNGEPHVAIYGLTAGRYVGEAVELGGALVHLVILEGAA